MNALGNVTDALSAAPESHEDIREAIQLLYSCKLFTATRAAALGEVSEILIERSVGGKRCRGGNKGFDLVSQSGERIEVKSRLIAAYDKHLKFDFGPNVRKHADKVYCVVWDGRTGFPKIIEAYSLPVQKLPVYQGLSRYCSRIDLKWLRGLGEGSDAQP